MYILKRVECHSGFKPEWKSIGCCFGWGFLATALLRQHLWDRTSHVACTGHSMGGSLCDLFSACVNSQRHLEGGMIPIYIVLTFLTLKFHLLDKDCSDVEHFLQFLLDASSDVLKTGKKGIKIRRNGFWSYLYRSVSGS